MYKILKKRVLNENVILMELSAEYIARKALAGQFIILRTDEKGERIPLTIADYDRENKTITIIFQTVGLTTQKLSRLEEGESILDLAGPLGHPTPLPEGAEHICVIGGGVGCAIAYPQAAQLRRDGIKNDAIIGFRNKDLVILEEEFKKNTDKLIVCTDDGSYGYKGFVTNALEDNIKAGAKYDLVIAIGPVPMMKFVTKTAEKYGIPTVVSLNPIMVDGTGMCGCCRVTVDGVTRYACVDGPDFDGSKVDFNELMRRNATYLTQEHTCRIRN